MDKIKVIDFVNEYNKRVTEKTKEEYVKSIISRKYVPILEKKIALQIMLDKSIFTDINGIKFVDKFSFRINTIISVLNLYTNLSMIKDADEQYNSFDDYDLLCQNGILNLILNNINESEISEYNVVKNNILDTFYNSEKTTEVFVANQIKRVTEILGTMTNSSLIALNHTLENLDEASLNKFVLKLKKLIK